MVLDDAAHALPMREDTTLGTINRLMHEEGATPEAILKALTTQKVDLIFTAHPTEARERKKRRERESYTRHFMPAPLVANAL
jgi:phosphoenolpyruvate carboxylase